MKVEDILDQIGREGVQYVRPDRATKIEEWTCEFKVPFAGAVLDDAVFMEALDKFTVGGNPHIMPGDTLSYSYKFQAHYFGDLQRRLAALQYLLCDTRVVKVRMDAKTILGDAKGGLLDLLRQIESIEGSLS